jgi:F-type H+-transporting ATPase subunit a
LKLLPTKIENGTILQRSLRASWLLALAIVGLLAPSHPVAALCIAAGQILAALNFFFLEKLVKLFTHASLSASPAEGAVARLRFLGWTSVKLLVVYGGAFALTRWERLQIWPLVAGLSLPMTVIFLKALMLAATSGWSPLRTRHGGRGSVAMKAASSLLLAAAISSGAAAALATTSPPAPEGSVVHTESPANAPPHDEASAGGEHGGGGEQHLPNWLTILNDWAPSNPIVHWMHENEYLVFAWVAGLVFFAIVLFAMRRGALIPGQIQNGIEWVVESMEDVVGGMMGKHTQRYFPFIMAIFFYILTMNMIGIIPGFKSSTSTLDVTLALALITFLYVQLSGIRNLGILGYLDHLAGSPRDVVGFAMLPVMIPVHILGELVKPVSLSCRLFGNIFGEDTLIVVFVGVAALCLKASLVALAVPPMLGITALFMMLQTLTSIVQALIFALLTTVYLYMMLPHEPHDHGSHEHEAPAVDLQHVGGSNPQHPKEVTS